MHFPAPRNDGDNGNDSEHDNDDGNDSEHDGDDSEPGGETAATRRRCAGGTTV
ncbi:hypothetical protein [Streptomyces wuyuanensis]|uniref:hypothetical protein n=1 Tax=Streptomyces wuyuanensis TaxID=1196353 RepID=UPI0037249764